MVEGSQRSYVSGRRTEPYRDESVRNSAGINGRTLIFVNTKRKRRTEKKRRLKKQGKLGKRKIRIFHFLWQRKIHRIIIIFFFFR